MFLGFRGYFTCGFAARTRAGRSDTVRSGFFADEGGAATTQFVVVSAMAIALCALAMNPVGSGSNAAAESIGIDIAAVSLGAPVSGSLPASGSSPDARTGSAGGAPAKAPASGSGAGGSSRSSGGADGAPAGDDSADRSDAGADTAFAGNTAWNGSATGNGGEANVAEAGPCAADGPANPRSNAFGRPDC